MIKITNLIKKYKDKLAVNNVSFEVQEATITGFIGENGAGKSTTLRCILDLTNATSGSIEILGTRYKNISNPSKIIGVSLDASKLNSSLSGYQILKIACYISETPFSRIKEVLNECDLLEKDSKNKVKTYSLGMRQRLSLACALLTKPKLLILDEPINGLDPRGIIWFRQLLRKYVEQGGTVLLSSHLLSEMEKIADHIVMISNGKIIANDSLNKLCKNGKSLEEIYLNCTSLNYNNLEGRNAKC